jgi:hypothetical protein
VQLILVPKKKRLGKESMRNFDACALCLNSAREPVACHEGHLFCKECVYTDLCEFFFALHYGFPPLLIVVATKSHMNSNSEERYKEAERQVRSIKTRG